MGFENANVSYLGCDDKIREMGSNLASVCRRGNVLELGEPRVETTADLDEALRVVVHKILISLNLKRWRWRR